MAVKEILDRRIHTDPVPGQEGKGGVGGLVLPLLSADCDPWVPDMQGRALVFILMHARGRSSNHGPHMFQSLPTRRTGQYLTLPLDNSFLLIQTPPPPE